MQLWQRYRQPTSVEQALTDLEEVYPEGRVVSGGTDLLLDIRQGRKPIVDTLVDVANIGAMRAVEQVEDHILIGASVTHREILDSPLLEQHATCLQEACGVIGGPQVRNVATIGGNVAHGLPAADGTIALLALGAEAEIASSAGSRWEPLGVLFVGPGKTTFDRGREILTRFRFPSRPAKGGSAFARVMRPQGVAIAILNIACYLEVEAEGQIVAARLAVGPSGPTPRRADGAEQGILGLRDPLEAVEVARQHLLEESQFRTSRYRATKDYRQHLVRTLLDRTLPLAYERARNDGRRRGTTPRDLQKGASK